MSAIGNQNEFNQAVQLLLHSNSAGKRKAEELDDTSPLVERITEYVTEMGLGVIPATLHELYHNSIVETRAQETLLENIFHQKVNGSQLSQYFYNIDNDKRDALFREALNYVDHGNADVIFKLILNKSDNIDSTLRVLKTVSNEARRGKEGYTKVDALYLFILLYCPNMQVYIKAEELRDRFDFWNLLDLIPRCTDEEIEDSVNILSKVSHLNTRELTASNLALIKRGILPNISPVSLRVFLEQLHPETTLPIIKQMEKGALTALLRAQDPVRGLTLLHIPIYFKELEPYLEKHDLQATQFPSRRGMIADSHFFHALDKLSTTEIHKRASLLIDFLDNLNANDRQPFITKFVNLSNRLNWFDFTMTMDLLEKLKNPHHLDHYANIITSWTKVSPGVDITRLASMDPADQATLVMLRPLFTQLKISSYKKELILANLLLLNLSELNNGDQVVRRAIKLLPYLHTEDVSDIVEVVRYLALDTFSYDITEITRNRIQKALSDLEEHEEHLLSVILNPLFKRLTISDNDKKTLLKNLLPIELNELNNREHVIERTLELLPLLKSEDPSLISETVKYLATGTFPANIPDNTRNRIENALYSLVRSKPRGVK